MSASSKPLKLSDEQFKFLQKELQIRLNAYIPHAPHPTQHAFLWLNHVQEILFGGSAGGGKLLYTRTPVATPSGWTTIGDLKPGDYVFGMDGLPTKVVACSKVEFEPCFNLHFDDGTSIIAGARHQWLTISEKERRAARRIRAGRLTKTQTHHEGQIRETWEIAQTLKRDNLTNHHIPVSKPLLLPTASLPIDPYILGVWLGDGVTVHTQVGIHEQGIMDQLAAAGAILTKRNSWGYFTLKGLRHHFTALGLLGNKHIPSQYLRASAKQRLSLLQGLMDTDGSVDEKGCLSFFNTDENLVWAFWELALSLGIKVGGPSYRPPRQLGVVNGRRINSKEWGYKFTFTSRLPVFRLKRKLDRQRKQWLKDTGTNQRRFIVDCKRTVDVPLRCIQVESEDGMFLAGKQMVPTHNSDALLMSALQFCDIPGYHAIMFRRTFADLNLAGSLIPRSQEWLIGTDARYNENSSRWTFPSGATLEFGYMRNDNDRMRYKSAEYSGIFFDEVTSFTKLQYTYMFSRLRKPSSLNPRDPLNAVPLRMRAASNPGGIGHLWVKNRFIKPVGRRENEPEDPGQRIFLPSRLHDNPSIDEEQYKLALAEVDEATRAQLLDGDWDAREPGQWVIPDQTWIDAAVNLGRQIWEQGEIPRDWNKPIAFGLDTGEFTQCYILVPMPNGGVYVMPSEVIGQHEDPLQVGIRILEKAEHLRVQPTVVRYDAAGIQFMRTFAVSARKRPGWERLKSQKIPFGKYKRESMNYLRLLFRNTASGKTSRVIAIHPANQTLITQLRAWQRKNEESDEVIKVNDHGPDAILAGIAPIAAAHRAYIEEMIAKAKRQRRIEDSY